MYNCALGNPRMSVFYSLKTFGILARFEEVSSIGELNVMLN